MSMQALGPEDCQISWNWKLHLDVFLGVEPTSIRTDSTLFFWKLVYFCFFYIGV